MAQARPIWRLVFWIILILLIAKFWLLWSGATLLVTVSRWFWWLSLIVVILVMIQLYRLLFPGTITLRSFITYWVVWMVILLLAGLLAKGMVWTGTWRWTSTAPAAAAIPAGAPAAEAN